MLNNRYHIFPFVTQARNPLQRGSRFCNRCLLACWTRHPSMRRLLMSVTLWLEMFGIPCASSWPRFSLIGASNLFFVLHDPCSLARSFVFPNHLRFKRLYCPKVNHLCGSSWRDLALSVGEPVWRLCLTSQKVPSSSS